VFDWANRQIGFSGELPTSGESATRLVRRVFPGFDEIAPVIRELLVAPESLLARTADPDARRGAAIELVRREAPSLDAASTQRVAAAVQLLTTAAAWQTLRDYWDVDGAEAAETAALAIELVLEGARARTLAPDAAAGSRRPSPPTTRSTR